MPRLIVHCYAYAGWGWRDVESWHTAIAHKLRPILVGDALRQIELLGIRFLARIGLVETRASLVVTLSQDASASGESALFGPQEV